MLSTVHRYPSISFIHIPLDCMCALITHLNQSNDPSSSLRPFISMNSTWLWSNLYAVHFSSLCSPKNPSKSLWITIISILSAIILIFIILYICNYFGCIRSSKFKTKELKDLNESSLSGTGEAVQGGDDEDVMTLQGTDLTFTGNEDVLNASIVNQGQGDDESVLNDGNLDIIGAVNKTANLYSDPQQSVKVFEKWGHTLSG